MITNDEQLRHALDQLVRMYLALAALRKEVLPKNRRWFTLMAEGPVDEIRQLEEQIGAYTGRAEAAIHDEGTRESAHDETHAEMGSIGS